MHTTTGQNTEEGRQKKFIIMKEQEVKDTKMKNTVRSWRTEIKRTRKDTKEEENI
jgi:hypothetical protein